MHITIRVIFTQYIMLFLYEHESHTLNNTFSALYYANRVHNQRLFSEQHNIERILFLKEPFGV